MNELDSVYQQSKEAVLAAIPSYWPEMRFLCDDFVDETLLPEVITPAACCSAVGGELIDTKEIGGAIIAAEISVRLLDDLTDRDKPNALFTKIGMSRTLNYVDAFRTAAYKILCDKCLNDNRYLKVMQAFTECYMVVLAGQDRDLRQRNINWEEGWKTVEMKTGYIYATTAAMGALVGTDNEEWIEACKKYGFHLGMAIQIFNDLDGIWSPEGIPDLEQGKVTLPVLYALRCEHEAKEELSRIVKRESIARESKRVKEILDEADAKNYLLWTALRQREKGLSAISVFPDNKGKEILEAHFTSMFGDIDQLATAGAPENYYEIEGSNIHDLVTLERQKARTGSKVLGLRKGLRRESF